MSAGTGPLTVFGASLLLLALVSALRSREADWPRIRWFVASILSLATSTAVTILSSFVDLPDAAVLVRSAAFLASGLLLVAFRHAYVPCGRAWWGLSGAGAGLALGAIAASVPPMQFSGDFTPAQVAVVLVWSVTVLSVAASFWRLGRGRSPTQRSRMRSLAVGVASIAVLLTSLATVNGGVTSRHTITVATLAALSLATLLGIAISPPAWVRRLQGGSHRDEIRAEVTRRIALATDLPELGEAAVGAAEQLVGAQSAFLVEDGQVIAASRINAATVERLAAWSDGDPVERTVRVDDGDPVLVTLRRTSSTGIIGVVSGPFTPVFGSDEGSQLDELAATVGIALTRVQLFEDLRRETERSQALLAAVSDLGEGVFVSDGHRFTEVNDAFARMLGMTRSQVLRLPGVTSVLPPRLRDQAQRIQEEVISGLEQGKLAERFETRMLRADGREIVTAVAVRTLETDRGLRLIGAVADITSSRRALRDQQRRAQHLAALRQLESTVAGMAELPPLIDAITEATGDLLRCRVVAIHLVADDPSASVAKSRGLTIEEAAALERAMERTDRLRPVSVARVTDLDAGALGLPPGHPLDDCIGVAMPCGDGVVGVMLVAGRSGRPSFDEIDRATLRDLASYVTEVSQTIRTLAAEREAAEQLREVDETRDLLLSAVSHDLRSPLSTIATMARTLEIRGEQFEDTFRIEMARRIHKQAVRLGRVVTDLLDMDRLRRGLLVAERRPVSLADLISESLDGVDRRDLERITTDVDDVIVNLDAAKVERAVENLVTNAVRHTPETSHIWLEAHERGDEVRIVVEDDGPGIDPEMRDRIFEPFERGARTGFGLGLALVRRIAELHDGHADVEPRAEGGSRFILTLAHPAATRDRTSPDTEPSQRDR